MRFFSLVEQAATYTHGTTSFEVGDAIPGRLGFSTLVSESGERFYYHAETADKTQWELGIGTWDGGGNLTRVAVLQSSASGAGVNFSADVVLRLVQPAGSMLVVDLGDPTTTPQAFGEEAMAAGPSAVAWGDRSMAIGKSAAVGFSSGLIEGGLALGWNAQSQHLGAAALGAYAYTVMPYALHGAQSVLWSGTGFTSGATSNDLTINSNTMWIPTDTVFAFKAVVVGRSGSNAYAAMVRGLVRRGSSGDAVIVGTPAVTEIEKSGGVAVSATVVALSSGSFAIRATGAAAQDWSWSASVHGAWR